MSARRSGKTDCFAIVAVGASAGGLEAFAQLLGALPSDTGMGFVFVQHLDPVHRSALPELLSKTAAMPVLEATNGAAVQPNHVYVIPPNVRLGINRRRLRFSPRATRPGPHTPIDFFMESLARAQQRRSIGVVLSGTASDGTRGLAAIKAAGGVTFAQDEKSAKYSGMPHSAIASGSVDFVLPPNGIARALARIGSHSYLSADAREVAQTTPQSHKTAVGNLEPILALLRDVGGIDFARYKPGTVQRRTLRRMALHGIERAEDYAHYLGENPEEIQRLFRELLIPVTSFFRNPEALAALGAKVFPKILNKKSPNEPIRIWTAGCSTGEETYSIAILLLEFLGDRANSRHIQLFGTDANERGIEVARLGIYNDRIAQEVSPERLHRFFTAVTGGYRVTERIRRLCVFAQQNVTEDPPFSRMDLICCRNLVIYFGTELQKRAGSILHYALTPSGFLLLGSGDSVGAFPQLFAPIDKKHKIYVRRDVAPKMHLHEGMTPRDRYSTIPSRSAQLAESAEGADQQHQADRIVLKKYAPPGLVVDDDLQIVQFRGAVAPFVQPAPGRASLHLLKIANTTLVPTLRVAMIQAKKALHPVKLKAVEFRHNGRPRSVDISVESIASGAHKHYLVLFQPASRPMSTATGIAGKGRGIARTAKEENAALRRRVNTLQRQLNAVIGEKEASDESFQVANEELLSINEEFQSTNEELETSKEELQSTNEELQTLNDELRTLNLELERTNTDLKNVLGSMSLPIVMVDRELRIRRVTAAAERTLKILPWDVGRPITDIRSDLDLPHIDRLISDVIEQPVPTESEVQDHAGHWYALNIRPYRAADGTPDGAVIVLSDIDAAKRASEHTARLKDFLEDILATVREPLLVLDELTTVLYANPPFLDAFGVSAEETLGKTLGRLGNGEWDIPALRARLETVAANGSSAQGFEVERDFPAPVGMKTMLLNARRIVDAHGGEPRILLAIEDTTERKRAQRQLETSHRELESLVAKRTESLRQLANDLLHAQDNERRRIARELHDSIGQQLAIAKMSIDAALATAPEGEQRHALSEIAETLHKCWSETRTVSHLLHPPILEALGFNAAAELFITGFSERSGVAVNVKMPAERVLNDSAVELALFRILQESLTNAHRHSGSGSVDVNLTVGVNGVTLEVRDRGKGIPAPQLQRLEADGGEGMGLPGMRARVRELGGELQIESDLNGTLIRARLPFGRASSERSGRHRPPE